MVVAYDEAGPCREALAEIVLPPVHRGARSHDEEDRRVAGVAEGADAEIRAVGSNDAFAWKIHAMSFLRVDSLIP